MKHTNKRRNKLRRHKKITCKRRKRCYLRKRMRGG
jgi:hypothetical protein